MPWFRQPQLILSRIVGLSTTLWFCCKVGSWAKNLSRLGSLLFRLLRPGRLWRYPDYGHLLMVPLYPGNPPTSEAFGQAQRLVEEVKTLTETEVDQSMELLGEAILLNPPGVEVYLLRAQKSNSHGMHIAALDDAEMCVSIDSKCAEGWLEKGKAEMALGRALDAAQSFHQGLQLAPDHQDLKERFDAARAEPSPNILHQFKDLVFAARLGLESLFRTLEDPQKTNDAFVEGNMAVLDTQLGLLAQTLHVNTSVLFESPRLCDAYDQIVRACSQLVQGAPGAFSRRLQHAESITQGLCLAVRNGWHIHHGIAKHAATALIMLSLCPSADEALRRLAVKQLLGGLLRWLLDARPEPEREGEEVCGCNCPVPWKAAACFLERLLEPRSPLVQQECEQWPDTVQLCQWLTLSVRDYHATPLGLVALLQMPKVAMKAMKSQAKVDFFIAPHIFGDWGDPLSDSGDEKDESEGPESWDSPEDTLEAASASDVPWWRAAQMSRQPLRAWRAQLRFVQAAAEAAAATDPARLAAVAHGETPEPPQMPVLGEGALRWLPDPPPPAAQRLGEWLMNSLGYLFLFIEGDALFTVYACQALKALAVADEEGRSRLLHGLWLGLPLLSKLSLAACTNTAALDLLHCLLEVQDPAAQKGISCAVRSLAYALAEAKEDEAPADEAPAVAPAPPEAAEAEVPPWENELPEMEGAANLFMAHEDDLVPSWAEFHHELFQELACPSSGDGSAPDLVTLANFEVKANFLAEHATLHAVASGSSTFTCGAVPAAWNRSSSLEDGVDAALEALGDGEDESPWQTVSSCRLPIFFEENALVGADDYISDERKKGKAVLMSRRSIRSSSKVHNWAQAVSSAEQSGAKAVVVFNDLDLQEPFRMGLFGEKLPKIPAFMVSGKDGLALCAAKDCDLLLVRSVLASSQETPPWPLAGGRVADLAQAWSLLEALSAHGPGTGELDQLLQRMSVPEKRVWLTRRLVRHHRTQQDAATLEPPLAFVEGDRWLTPVKQLEALRKQYCEGIGIGSPDICGEFEVRFRGEQGVGSAVVREWMDLVAREVYLQPSLRLLRSYDQRQTFWPDLAATFCNNCWKMDFEILGCLIGLALWQNCTLDLPLHPHICALLFGLPPEQISTTLSDLDPELYKHKVQWLLANPINDLGVELSFSDPLGPSESKDEEVQSLPSLLSQDQRLPGDSSSSVLMRVESSEVLLDDAESTVTDENKHRFIALLERWKLHEGISGQIEAMAKGLCKVVPNDLREEMHGLLTPLEIAQLLSGLGTLNVQDWETHTAYTHGLYKESPVVRWFWQVVHDWADSEESMLPQLLQFVTGSARVPVGGFSELVGFNGSKHAFTLAQANHLSKDSLPVAHTCICTLDMPPYPDLDTCRHKMTQMLRLGRSHFDEGAGQAET